MNNSFIEENYFIDEDKYNCPFCHNRGIKYVVLAVAEFDESNNKKLKAVFVECSHCHKVSMHIIKNNDIKIDYNVMVLSSNCKEFNTYAARHYNSTTVESCTVYRSSRDNEIYPICEDNSIILSIPTSFFTIDERIPKVLRDLIHESEKCIQNNCLTGASACIRKAIYEFLVKENAQGDSYDEKMKSLKGKYMMVDDDHIDILVNIQGIMCDKVHEASINQNFTSQEAKAYLELLKTIFNQVYVIPQELKEQKNKVSQFFGNLKKARNNS